MKFGAAQYSRGNGTEAACAEAGMALSDKTDVVSNNAADLKILMGLPLWFQTLLKKKGPNANG